MRVHLRVCVCVCVCVWERKNCHTELMPDLLITLNHMTLVNVCVHFLILFYFLSFVFFAEFVSH